MLCRAVPQRTRTPRDRMAIELHRSHQVSNALDSADGCLTNRAVALELNLPKSRSNTQTVDVAALSGGKREWRLVWGNVVVFVANRCRVLRQMAKWFRS